MKNELYIATVVKAYRTAIDAYFANPEEYTTDPALLEELTKASFRGFTTGFFFGKPGADDQVYTSSSYIQNYEIVAVIRDYDDGTKIARAEQRNRFFEGDTLEVLSPNLPSFSFVAQGLRDEEDNPITATPHAAMQFTLPLPQKVPPYSILRKKKGNA